MTSQARRTVYIEDSRTPIYRRIANALGAELARRGLDVFVVKPDGFNSTSFRDFLASRGAATYVSNSVRNAIQSRLPDKEDYFFEHFPGRLVFLHQDMILGGHTLMEAVSKLSGWKRVAGRSAHLCIEPGNLVELASVGIEHARWVPHATEIAAQDPHAGDFAYGTTFVGHALPSVCRPSDESPRVRRVVDEALSARRADFGARLQPLVQTFVDQAADGMGPVAEQPVLKVAHAQWLRSQISNQSMPFRGWLFEQEAIGPVDIFGGDPAYLSGVARNLQVHRTGVTYHPAMHETAEVQQIYRQSRVNVNLSSLQFDDAVVNRFHDVTMAGGLCLTDERAGLPELTPAHADVSYRTVDELADRVRFFSDPANERQRSALIRTLQRDVAANSGYPRLAEAIVGTLDGL